MNAQNWNQIAETVPGAAFMRKYNLPAYGLNPAQEWQASQYGPAYGTYLAQSALNPQAGAPGWQDWMDRAAVPGGAAIPSTRQQAAGLYSQAMGQGAPEQQAFRETMGGDFNDLIGAMLSNFYAAPIAQRMQQRVNPLMTQFTGETQGQGGQFLQYLAQKLGLGNLLTPA